MFEPGFTGRTIRATNNRNQAGLRIGIARIERQDPLVIAAGIVQPAFTQRDGAEPEQGINTARFALQELFVQFSGFRVFSALKSFISLHQYRSNLRLPCRVLPHFDTAGLRP